MSSPFPIDWPELKERRLEKDDHSCIECGTDKKLYIAIEKTPDEFDHPGEAWDVGNLMTLCSTHIVEGGKSDETRIEDTFGVTTDSNTESSTSSSTAGIDNSDTDDSLGGMATFDVDESGSESSTDSDSTTNNSQSSDSNVKTDDNENTSTDPFDDVNDANSVTSHPSATNSGKNSVSTSSGANTNNESSSGAGTTTHATSDPFGSFTPGEKRGAVMSNGSGTLRQTVRSIRRLGFRSYVSHLAPKFETGQARWDGVYRFGENRPYTDTIVKILLATLLSVVGWVVYHVGVEGSSLSAVPNPIGDVSSIHHLVVAGGVVFAVTYFISMVLRVLVNSERERYASRWVDSHLHSLYKMGASVMVGLVSVQMVLGTGENIVFVFGGNILYMATVYGMVTSVNALLAEESRKNIPLTGGWVFEYILRVGGVLGVVEVLTGSMTIVLGQTAGIVVIVVPVVASMVYLGGILSFRMRA